METFTDKKIIVTNKETGQEQEFLPRLVQSCMNPEVVKSYPVSLEVRTDDLVITWAQGITQFSLQEYSYTLVSYEPQLPSHKPCGECQNCGKCC